MSTRAAPPPARTPVDLPIVGLLIAYTISFYNIEKASQLGPALTNVQLLVGCILMFYVFVNSVRTSADLARVHVFQCGSALAILLLTVWELNHPGQAFIPGWLNFASSGAIDPTKFELHTMRVGGPFFDFELMCEFCALTILLVIFLLNRPIAPFLKTLLFGLLALATFAMFATVTRGGFIAFLVGLGYLVWHIRRRLSFVPFTIIAAGAIIFILAVNFYVANFTNAGDLFYRLKGTEFVGMMPESRARAWPEAWERMMLHPIIGHGPYYAPSIGDKIYVWPHNVYLFIGNLVGIVGLSFFLLLAGILWVISRPRGDRLDDPSYARGFLLIGHVQLATFLVDQLKIDYLRNPIYQFQVWLLFSSIVAAHLIVRRERAARLAAGA